MTVTAADPIAHPVASSLEIAGALVEFDELCPTCKKRVLLVTPTGDGDLDPPRYHESANGRDVCAIAVERNDVLLSTARIDALLRAPIEEGPPQ